MIASDKSFWQVAVTAEKAEVEAIEELLSEAGAEAISSFEQEPGPSWHITALFADEPSRDELVGRLTVIFRAKPVADIGLAIEYLAARDWVSENLKSFPPLAVAGFWIHGGHTRPPDGTLTPILIDAGPAFGSGEHATTEGCLIAIDVLAGKHTVRRALDMGCGSGILAIAIAKRWPDAAVLGVDNDPPSVRFAREAVMTNGVAETVKIADGDGYQATEVAALGPFDLIAANILSRPLIAMAPHLARHLRVGGSAILSGLLVNQAAGVVSGHENHGLELVDRQDLRGWTTLVMGKHG